MGLLDEFGSWLDNKRRVMASNARDPYGLLSSIGADVRNFNAKDKSAWDATQSVMPEVRDQGSREMLQNWGDVGGLLGAIKVFHGSPHKFDKFDFSKIGTGEGAQTFGHGLYFADNPEVAKVYAETLAKTSPRDIKIAKDRLFELEHDNRMPRPPTLDAEIAQAKSAISSMEQRAGKMSMYESSLRWPDPAREAADPMGPQHFLDWDSLLSLQPQKVQDAVAKAFEKYGRKPNLKDIDGATAYRRLRQSQVNGNGTPVIGQEKASQALQEGGLPGIRYLDGDSRAAGWGTSNYVAFDDAITEILKRNGVPIQGLLSP